EVGAGGSIVLREVFHNLSVKDSAGRVDTVLEAQSSLLRWDGIWPPDPLPRIADSDDDVTKAEKELAANPQDAGAQAAVTAARQATGGSDGIALTNAENFTPEGGRQNKRGLYALERVDSFNLLCIPPYLASGDVAPAL